MVSFTIYGQFSAIIKPLNDHVLGCATAQTKTSSCNAASLHLMLRIIHVDQLFRLTLDRVKSRKLTVDLQKWRSLQKKG